MSVSDCYHNTLTSTLVLLRRYSYLYGDHYNALLPCNSQLPTLFESQSTPPSVSAAIFAPTFHRVQNNQIEVHTILVLQCI